jgi:hypothetical protein
LFQSKKRTQDSPKKDPVQTKKGMGVEAGKDGFSRPLSTSTDNIFMNKNPSSSIWGSLPRRLSGGRGGVLQSRINQLPNRFPALSLSVPQMRQELDVPRRPF